MPTDVCTPDPCQDMTDDQIQASCALIVTSAIDTLVEQMLMDQGPDGTDPHRIVDRFVTELRRVRGGYEAGYREARTVTADAVRVEVAQEIAVAIARAGGLPRKPAGARDKARLEAYRHAVAIATEHAAAPGEVEPDAR